MNTTCQFEATIAEKDVQLFSQLSGDTNPLHLDAAYAGTTEFGRPIVHGAYLVGLVSRVLGMYIPGRESLILSMNIRFPKPLFYPARVQVQGRLRTFNETRNMGTVDVFIEDSAKGWPVVEAEVTFSCHQLVTAPVHAPMEAVRSGNAFSETDPSKNRRLLITGGTGGMGSGVLPALMKFYSADCLTRNFPVEGKTGKELRYHAVDLDKADALERLLAELDPHTYYGIVHLSSPPMTRSFVSDDIALVRRHLRQSVEVPLQLTAWAKQAGSSVKRIVLMGSTAGAKYPKPHFGAYSLGKAAMEHLVRILPADLSAQQATINVVIPSALPVGMNEAMPVKSRKALEARMPLGTLVEPQDVAQVILFLLSEAARQVNGSTITVDGGFSEAS